MKPIMENNGAKRYSPYESPHNKIMPSDVLGIDFTLLHPDEQHCKMAVDTIECIAVRKNKPSTYAELAAAFALLNPGVKRCTAIKVKDHVNQWTTRARASGIPGVEHTTQPTEHFGYICAERGYHKVCKARSKIAGGKLVVCWIDEQLFPIFNRNGTIIRPQVRDRRPMRRINRKSSASSDSGSERYYLSPPSSDDGMRDVPLIFVEELSEQLQQLTTTSRHQRVQQEIVSRVQQEVASIDELFGLLEQVPAPVHLRLDDLEEIELVIPTMPSMLSIRKDNAIQPNVGVVEESDLWNDFDLGLVDLAHQTHETHQTHQTHQALQSHVQQHHVQQSHFQQIQQPALMGMQESNFFDLLEQLQ